MAVLALPPVGLLRPATVSTESLATSSTRPVAAPTSSSVGRWTPPPSAPASTPTRPALAPTASVPLASAESHGNTWQTIAIVLIAVLFVAAAITCAVFCDRLWSRLKDLVCCVSRPPLSEQFIPDHDGRSLSRSADLDRNKGALCEGYTTRELPWNTNTDYWSRRQRTGEPPTA